MSKVKRILHLSWDIKDNGDITTPVQPTITEINKRPQEVQVERIEKRGER